MPKPQLIVGGESVTSIVIPDDDTSYVTAVISAPTKPNAQYTLTMDGLCPVNSSGGKLNSSGLAQVIFGPRKQRMRGKVAGQLSVPGLTNNNFTVTFL